MFITFSYWTVARARELKKVLMSTKSFNIMALAFVQITMFIVEHLFEKVKENHDAILKAIMGLNRICIGLMAFYGSVLDWWVNQYNIIKCSKHTT